MDTPVVNMYFVAIVLPQDLNEKVLRHKILMQEKYNCQVALKSPAHITITPPFWLNIAKEDDLVRAVDTLSRGIRAFPVTTNHFSAFIPRTIFIDIESNDQLRFVKKSADDFFTQHPEFNIKNEGRPFRPHITVATRDLHKKSFHEAWSYFQHQVFEEKWIAGALSVLRHNKKNWDVIHTSQFQKI